MSVPVNRKWRLANRALLLQTLAFAAALYACPTAAAQALLAYCGGVSVTLGFYAGANVWQDRIAAQAQPAPYYAQPYPPPGYGPPMPPEAP